MAPPSSRSSRLTLAKIRRLEPRRAVSTLQRSRCSGVLRSRLPDGGRVRRHERTMKQGHRPKARTGVPGLDDILLGGLAPRPDLPARRQPGHRQDHHGAALPAGRRRGGRTRPLRHPVRDRARAAGHRGARTAGSLDDKIDVFEVVPPESLLDADQQQSLLYSSDLELGETTRLIFEAVERTKADARRARFAVGDPPAGPEFAALSPADPGAEALFRPPRRRPCCFSTTSRPTRSTRRCTASPTASCGSRR